MSIPKNYQFAFGNIWLSSRDFFVFANHTITEDEAQSYFGDDDKDVFLQNVIEIANGQYTMHQLRYDILRYNELFKDESFDNSHQS